MRPKQTARKSTGGRPPEPRPPLLCRPAWAPPASILGTVDGVLTIRLDDHRRNEATWSLAHGQSLLVQWSTTLEQIMARRGPDRFAALTGIRVAQGAQYWFENENGDPYYPDTTMPLIWVGKPLSQGVVIRVVIRTTVNPKATKALEGGRGMMMSIAGPKSGLRSRRELTAEEYQVDVKEHENRCMVDWGDCDLVLPWSYKLGNVARAIAALDALTVAAGNPFHYVTCEGDVVRGDSTLAEVMERNATVGRSSLYLTVKLAQDAA